MKEMLTPTSAAMGAGLGKGTRASPPPACPRTAAPAFHFFTLPAGMDVAMLTDGRFSGGSHGFIIGHVSPEAQARLRLRFALPFASPWRGAARRGELCFRHQRGSGLATPEGGGAAETLARAAVGT